MINSIIKMLMFCLLETILVEVLVSFVLRIKSKKDFLNIILVNIMTNPLLNIVILYINIFYGLFYRNIALFILEILVVLSEGYIYKKYLDYKRINPYLLSLILNGSSYLVGLLVNKIIY